MEKHIQIYSRKTAKKLGLTRYFTGKPCKSGHTVERRTTSGCCIDCEKIWSKPKPNTESEKNRKRKWYQDNIEKSRKSGRISASRNKEKQKERHKEWYKNNKESKDKKSREWAKNNIEKPREYTNRWRMRNPEAAAAYRQNRRSYISRAEGFHSGSELSRLFEMQRGKCASCWISIKKSGHLRYHADHITPISKGGSNWITNIQLLCKRCNLSKGAKTPEEWAKINGKII